VALGGYGDLRGPAEAGGELIELVVGPVRFVVDQQIHVGRQAERGGMILAPPAGAGPRRVGQ
jgi:hypothetical protein